MPIANCLVSPNCAPGTANLIKLWARESGISSQHMTVNVTGTSQQYGESYLIMATLWLPSIWSESEVSSLQSGLARALATYYEVGLPEVHVVTQVVNSGRVVENGLEVTW